VIDRRRSEFRTDSATLGAILLVMGWFASPWNGDDTLFTRVLASQGLEHAWGIIMMLTGGAKIVVSLVLIPRPWIEPYWDRIKVTTTLLLVFVASWTFLHFVEAELYTPTVLALGVIAFGALATLIRDATTRKALRCRYGRLGNHG
jgi:hypothetical protein